MKLVAETCPFPDCGPPAAQTQSSALRMAETRVSGLLHCTVCDRLSVRCIHPGCRFPNRPFARYCVRCGGSQWDIALPQTVADSWRVAEMFPSAPPVPVDRPLDFSATELIATLDPVEFPSRVELVQWTIGAGIILLHQGGGGMAAIHAMRNGETDSRPTNRQASVPFWTVRERDVFTSPNNWPEFAEGHYHFAPMRPFRPEFTEDYRFAVFSAPYGVAVWPMCDLPGWSTGEGRRLPKTILRLGGQAYPEFTVAAPPVVLDRRVSSGLVESELGLVIAKRDRFSSVPEYYWWTISLNSDKLACPEINETTLPDHLQPLPLRGSCVQVERLRSNRAVGCRGLLFATPEGMWVTQFRRGHATRPIDVSPIQLKGVAEARPSSVPGAEPNTRIALNADVESRNRLRWDRMSITNSVAGEFEDAQYTVWYWERRGPSELFMGHFTLVLTVNNSAIVVEPRRESRAGLPVGMLNKGGSARYLLLSTGEGSLFEHQLGANALEIKKSFVFPVGDVTSLALSDSLLITVRRPIVESRPLSVDVVGARPARDSEAASYRSDLVSIRSALDADSPAAVITPKPPRTSGSDAAEKDGLQLEATPVFWLDSLFLCERRNAALRILRFSHAPPSGGAQHPRSLQTGL